MPIPGEQSFEGDDVTITNIFRTIAGYDTREVGISVRFVPAWNHPYWQPTVGRSAWNSIQSERKDAPKWGTGDRWASVSVPRVSALNGLRPGTFHNWGEWFSRLRGWPDGTVGAVAEVKLWPGPP